MTEIESDDSYVVIRCQRCNAEGGMATYGWAILCSQCKSLDDQDWWEDATPN